MTAQYEESESWREFVRFLRGSTSEDIRPVKRLRVRKEMFTFPKGMECWIGRDGHMYTLERDYHANPRIIQMYVAPTIARFSHRLDEFFEELPMLDGEVVAPRSLEEPE